MRFQITIKEQAQATNGKAKYPLYKPKTQRNYDLDYGTETLNQLINNSSIKIYCNQCLKEITLDTIVVAYQTYQNQPTTQNQSHKPLQNPPTRTIKQTNANKKDTTNTTVNKKDNKEMEKDDNELFEQSDESEDDVDHQNHRQTLEQMREKENINKLRNLQQPHQQSQIQENKQKSRQVSQLLPKNQGQKQQQQTPHHYQTSELYCVGCFSSLQQFPSSYMIRKSLNMSLKGQKWRIIDEICLLNGLKCWGFSNWGQIKQFMDYNGCPFTVKEIESHYEEVYLKGDGPFKELEKGYIFMDRSESSQDLYRKLFSKPPKRLIEQIMHNYYFPKVQQQGISRGHSNRMLQGNVCNKESLEMKRERPKEFDYEDDGQQQQREEEQYKLQLRKALSGHSKGLPSSKHPKSIFPLANTFSPSYTSLKSLVQKADHQQQDIHQKQEMQQNCQQDENQNDDDDSEQEDEEELFQGQEQDLNEIKLKPKESQMQLAGKVVHNNANGNKFVNVNVNVNEPALSINRANSIKPQSTQKLNINQQHPIQTHTHHHPHSPPIHPTYSNLKGHNIYSYNPKRRQFQIIEYDYYAETMLAQLQFLDDDTQEEKILKLKIIEEYNRRLDERIKRREFVIQHRLLDTEFMIKTLQKYNPNHVQRFQPFRRLLPRNQEYFQIVSTYDTLCKTKALTQGLVKIKKRLNQQMKKPTLQNVLEYLGEKKEKKEALGRRAKFQKEKQRRVLTRQSVGNVKGNKRVITSMSQNSSSYANIQQPQQQVQISHQQQQQSSSPTSRRMSSRSQQRQRLRSQNQNTFTGSKQQQKVQSQTMNMQQITLVGNQMKMVCNHSAVNMINSNNSCSLQSLISSQDMVVIENLMRRQLQLNKDNNNNNNSQNGTIKPVVLKSNMLAFPLSCWMKKDNSSHSL